MDTSTAHRCIWGAAIGGLTLFVWDLAAEMGLPEVNMTIPIRIHDLLLAGIIICVVVGAGRVSDDWRAANTSAKLDELRQEIEDLKCNIETAVRRGHFDPLSLNELSLNDPRYDNIRAHIDSLDDRKPYGGS